MITTIPLCQNYFLVVIIYVASMGRLVRKSLKRVAPVSQRISSLTGGIVIEPVMYGRLQKKLTFCNCYYL